jgi:hypothetical protein
LSKNAWIKIFISKLRVVLKKRKRSSTTYPTEMIKNLRGDNTMMPSQVISITWINQEAYLEEELCYKE